MTFIGKVLTSSYYHVTLSFSYCTVKSMTAELLKLVTLNQWAMGRLSDSGDYCMWGVTRRVGDVKGTYEMKQLSLVP